MGLYMGAFSTIMFLVLLAVIIILFWPKMQEAAQIAESVLSNNHPNLNFSANYTSSNHLFSPTQLINYTLTLINKDRSSNGLPNVTLSNSSTGQQHADSMLQYGYFSHWDTYGMKPYMRYTILGGRGSVQENLAYTKSGINACLAGYCTTYGNLNLTKSIAQLEYNMMYNDSACCNNGHRSNILDRYHNQVSLGIAYNNTNIYLVEDFINNYITWINGTPDNQGSEILLSGTTAGNYLLSGIEIGYEPPMANMTVQQLGQTSEYSYGASIAVVVPKAPKFYLGSPPLVADKYYVNGNSFQVSFSLQKLIKQYGAGEYSVGLWLNTTPTKASLAGSSYTFFVNSNGSIYVPNKV